MICVNTSFHFIIPRFSINVNMFQGIFIFPFKNRDIAKNMGELWAYFVVINQETTFEMCFYFLKRANTVRPYGRKKGVKGRSTNKKRANTVRPYGRKKGVKGRSTNKSGRTLFAPTEEKRASKADRLTKSGRTLFARNEEPLCGRIGWIRDIFFQKRHAASSFVSFLEDAETHHEMQHRVCRLAPDPACFTVFGGGEWRGIHVGR